MAEVVSRNTLDGFFLGDEFLVNHVDGNVDSGETGALTVTGLKHPELALLDGELDVLNVFKMLLEDHADLEQLLVGTGKVLGHLLDLLGRSNTGNHVFALGVDEILTVEHVLTGGGVASERQHQFRKSYRCYRRPWPER